MTDAALTRLSKILAERRERPDIDELHAGSVPVVAKVRFRDGGVELRGDASTKTELILARRGDILLSGINALKGAVALLPLDGPSAVAATIHYSSYAINTECAIPLYIWHYLRSDAFRRVAASQLPNGIKTELKARRLLSLDVPLPSIEEQEKILKRLLVPLDVAEQVARARSHQSEVILGRRIVIGNDVARLVVKALEVFQASISNLFEFGTLAEFLATGLRHGPAFPCGPDPDGAPVIMPAATTGFRFDMTKVSYSIGSPRLASDDYLRYGDILFARGNKPEQVGNCGVYEGESSTTTFANLYMRIRFDLEVIEPHFAKYWIMTPLAQQHIKTHTKGTGPSIQKINGQGVRTIPFPRGVPRPLQTRWVRHLDGVRHSVDSLMTSLKTQVADVERLKLIIPEEVFQTL